LTASGTSVTPQSRASAAKKAASTPGGSTFSRSTLLMVAKAI
jgi:hypothetical protein